MADTKVSGLPAAASFLGTHELPVNEAGASKKITGQQILNAVAQGTIGYAEVTANQGTFTARTDLTSLTQTKTLVVGRRYRITGLARFSSSVATDVIGFFIVDTTGPTDVATVEVPAISGVIATGLAQVILVPGAGAKTYKLQAQRDSGTGNVTMYAGVGSKAFILIEDIGT